MTAIYNISNMLLLKNNKTKIAIE